MSFTRPSPNLHMQVVEGKPGGFTVRHMTSIADWVRSLGNAGAVASAWRSCEERRLTEQRLESISARLAATPSVPAWETQTASGG